MLLRRYHDRKQSTHQEKEKPKATPTRKQPVKKDGVKRVESDK
ncbi:hypothetical protein ACQKNB_00935 [Lysinibacillus xylanilyticus]